jgi:parallel beta-helix repeat protein
MEDSIFMLRKGIVIIIICLFIGVNIIQMCGSISIKKENISNKEITNVKGTDFDKTIYVDDDNTDGPWDGSIEYPYKFIQDGIDAVCVGGIVQVFNGKYCEILTINKMLTLKGEDKNNTIIEGGWCNSNNNKLLKINTNNVNVSNLKFQYNGSDDIFYMIEVFYSNYVNISQNVFECTHGHYWGICLVGSNFCIVSKNEIFNFGVSILLGNSWNNDIFNNNIDFLLPESGDIYCIGFYISGSKDNRIYKNEISNQFNGFFFQSSSNNSIYKNIIDSNDYGIVLEDFSNSNKIYRNTISNNNYYDVYIKSNQYCEAGINNIIFNNNFINTTNHEWDDCDNFWDLNGKGNFWDDYEKKYPDAGKKELFGIWDTPYEIKGGNNYDNYPLIEEWKESSGKETSKNNFMNNLFLRKIINWLNDNLYLG